MSTHTMYVLLRNQKNFNAPWLGTSNEYPQCMFYGESRKNFNAPWFGTSNEYPQSMFYREIRKNLNAFCLKKLHYQELCKIIGPAVQSVVSLTSSLRVISLTVLADSIYNILIFFAEKM